MSECAILIIPPKGTNGDAVIQSGQNNNEVKINTISLMDLWGYPLWLMNHKIKVDSVLI